MLREMLSSAKDTADIVVEVLTTPVEKLKALLGAPDKKAHILEMAGNDEIDAPFIALLEQNIEAAKAARADDAAEFMGKVLEACQKWYVKDETYKKVEEEEERRRLLGEDGEGVSLDQAKAMGTQRSPATPQAGVPQAPPPPGSEQTSSGLIL